MQKGVCHARFRGGSEFGAMDGFGESGFLMLSLGFLGLFCSLRVCLVWG